jgi:hypothetical protein
MTRRRWLLAAVLAAVVTVIWFLPLVAGPEVDCGPLDRARCDEVWPLLVAGTSDRSVWLPVTRVQIREYSGAGCGSFVVERWIFGSMVFNDC